MPVAGDGLATFVASMGPKLKHKLKQTEIIENMLALFLVLSLYVLTEIIACVVLGA
jgi:hypothetical protein